MFLGDLVKCVLKEDLGTVVLSLSDLELGELDEELLVERSLAEFSQSTLIHKTCFGMLSLVFFEIGGFDIA